MKMYTLNKFQTFAIIHSRDVNCVGQQRQFESILPQRSEALSELHNQSLQLPHGFMLAVVTLIFSEPGWCKVHHVFHGHA
jgi:hypothetical protein